LERVLSKEEDEFSFVLMLVPTGAFEVLLRFFGMVSRFSFPPMHHVVRSLKLVDADPKSWEAKEVQVAFSSLKTLVCMSISQ
jgi:hypothetical protein